MHRVCGFAALLLVGVMLAGADTVAAAPPCAPGAPQVVIYHAGSLSAAFEAVEGRFTRDTGVCVVDVATGSVDAARRITAGQEPCDIFASADDVDIDVFLKPAGYADYTIRFAQGAMVLAYTTQSRGADAIAERGAAFDPPGSVPMAADDWARTLAAPGVLIAGSHPFLDPSGYRADMIFQLARLQSGDPGLYNTLLSHYTIAHAGSVLGTTHDYQFIYEHSALAAYRADTMKRYRYVRLPPAVGLSDSRQDARYRSAGVTMPGLGVAGAAESVRVPATRVTWGLTVMRTARNAQNAIRFLQALFGRDGIAALEATGPSPIDPPRVSRRDYTLLPPQLQAIVSTDGTER